jgi:hypothetical protein
VFFDEFDSDAFAGERLYNPAQVIQVAGEPIHAVNNHGITASHKAHQQFQLRPFRIFAGRFVGKGFVELDAIQLPFSILIRRLRSL